MNGTDLKKALGLSKFTYVYIQKLMGAPIVIFVVTLDSRFPSVYLPINRVRKSNVASIQKVQSVGIFSTSMQDYQFTPPVMIENTSPTINSGTLIIRRDIGAEYLLNAKMFESIENKNNFEVIEI